MLKQPKISIQKVVDEAWFVEQFLPAGVLRKLPEHVWNAYRLPFLVPTDRRVCWQFAQDLPVAGQPANTARLQRQGLEWLRQTTLPKLLAFATPGMQITAKEVASARQSLSNLQTVCLGRGLHFLPEDLPGELGRRIAAWVGTS